MPTSSSIAPATNSTKCNVPRPTKNQVDKSTGRAMSAVRWLADRCDGATSNDGAGFSGTDTALGHALAEKSIWSPRETLAAGLLIVKYRKQLEKGSVDITGINDLMQFLNESVKSSDKLRKRDIVEGDISVDEDSGQIVVRASYNNLLLDMCREMLGSKWDVKKKLWTSNLCAENAAAAEEIAHQFGIELKRHAGWSTLMSTRKVEIVDQCLIIRGVPSWAIIKSFPERKGKPSEDERVFSAFCVVDRESIGLSLCSWVIREALLWLETMQEGDANFFRLSWARDEVIGLLRSAYPKAMAKEREQFSLASAVSLAEDAQTALAETLPAHVAERLMPHQWVGVNALVGKKQLILADQQGLGKTIEILAALESVQAFPAIVIVPTSALLNWRDEAASWLPHRRVAVRGGGVAKRDEGVPIEDADIVIVNYESFSRYSRELAKVHPKAVVADEAQYLKEHSSQRTKDVKEFCQDNKVDRIIAASGTPVMNCPSELLTLLTLMPYALGDLGGFSRFASRYCNATRYTSGSFEWWDYKGAANLEELSDRLRESGRFIRRDKASVLLGLAAKDRETLDVAIDNRDEYQLATDDFDSWLKTKKIHFKRKPKQQQSEDAEINAIAVSAAWLGWAQEDIDGIYLDQSDRAEALRRMGVLRQLAGIGKITAALCWIRECVKDKKLVVFAYHLEVQNALLAALASDGIQTLSITGKMSTGARREAIRQFQCQTESRVIVCSLKASQTAITLTAAQCALMVELEWTPSALEQAEDRLHRIGQQGQVRITYLHAADTLDDRMIERLDAKRAKIEILVATNAPYGHR